MHNDKFTCVVYYSAFDLEYECLMSNIFSFSASRETSYSRSVIEGDIAVSDSESEAEDQGQTTCPVTETCHSEELLKGEVTARKLVEDEVRDESSPDTAEPRLLQDSGFSSEQTTTPQLSPLKVEDAGKVSDGNDSGSSFEEISMENVPKTIS